MRTIILSATSIPSLGAVLAATAMVSILAASAFSAVEPRDMNQLLGTWNGTSTCVNRQVAPSCKDETVVYEVRRSDKPQTAVLAADKIVDGKRVPMGGLEFTAPGASWSTGRT